MVKFVPFPKLSVKAAEAKSLLEPLSSFLTAHPDYDADKQEVLNCMVLVLDQSHAIDVLVDSMNDFKVKKADADTLERLVLDMNVGMTKLCHFFHKQGVYLFNFVPKHHYLFHIALMARQMSPKLAWCYKGEDMMQKVKLLAQGSFRGALPRQLGHKILAKYLVGLDCALAAL